MPRTVPRNASVSPKLEIGKGWQFFLFVQYLKLNIASNTYNPKFFVLVFI